VSLGFLFVLAWLTGRGFDYHFFVVRSLGTGEILAALLALAAAFGLRAVARAMRSEDERRRMTVYLLAPRSAREWALWAGTVVAAGVAEEAAYRGVGMAILGYALGNP
jgi:membrane protease YdiL (CAAX protease family)